LAPLPDQTDILAPALNPPKPPKDLSARRTAPVPLASDQRPAWLRMARQAAVWAGVCGLLVVLSIAFIDRPVALLMHHDLRDRPIAAALARLPKTQSLVPELALATAALALAARVRVGTVLRVGALAMASFALGEASKDVLKYAVGRTWPETWVDNNPSFIRDGVFTFVPFHGGDGFGSFPSGHMTAASSVMVVAWLVIPRLRPLWGLIMLLCAALLLALNYHFVSDVVAGFFLGTACAVLVVRVARRVGPRRSAAAGRTS